MRVLYAVWNYPHLSESYIFNDLEFFLSVGVDIRVWAAQSSDSWYPEQTHVYRGKLAEAIEDHKPDLIYIQWLPVASTALYGESHPAYRWVKFEGDLGCRNIPIIVRGHSFDFSEDLVRLLLASPVICRIYLFPHQAKLFQSPKVRSLPVAYNPRFFYPGEKDDHLVLRAAAGLPTKALEDFFETARLTPGYRFALTAVKIHENGYIGQLKEQNRKLGDPVAIQTNVDYELMGRIMRQAGIYMDTYNPAAQPFGMPISVAEALATGAYVLVKDCPEVHDYVGTAGVYYDTPSDASKLIRESGTWDADRWMDVRTRAIKHAEQFSLRSVMPGVIEDWKEILGK